MILRSLLSKRPLALFLVSSARSSTSKLRRPSSSKILRLFSSSTMPRQEQPEPAFKWCCTASVNDKSDIVITKIAGYDNEPTKAFVVAKDGDANGESSLLDLTSSADWMEHMDEQLENQNGSAYDTMRCDYILHSDQAWRVWGQDFHLQRLQRSYQSLIKNNNSASNPDETQEEQIQQALQVSERVLEQLLREAEQAQVLKENEKKPFTWKDVEILLIRLTLLWTPPPSDGGERKGVIVRGHACSSAKVLQVHQPVVPIVATLTASATHHHSGQEEEEEELTVDENMPTRFQDPHAKVSSWTRLRKRMEKPGTYKPPGVSEVLMVRKRKDGELEVLEGLSSNFFVIYKDGSIRTAQDGVLNGYVRHLVLDCLDKCGIPLDPRPILVGESHEWKEAFITSSSRLIYPISIIQVHDEKGTGFEDFWKDPVLTAGDDDSGLSSSAASSSTPKWRQLLDEILIRGGYPSN